MLPDSLKKLIRQSEQGSGLVVAAILGTLAGLVVPAVNLMLGAILRCLMAAQLQIDPHTIPGPSRFLPDVQTWLSGRISTLAQLSYLLLATFVLVLVAAVILWQLYRQVQVAAVGFECKLIERFREHARQLATSRTLSAQQSALTDALDYHLPRVRAVLARWWRTFPRHAVQLGCCVVFCMLVQPMLAVLTIVATGLIYLVYRSLDRVKRSALPVVRERAGQLRASIVDDCLQGPLRQSHYRAAVTDGQGSRDERLSEQLTGYRRDAIRSLNSSSWKLPVLLVVFALVVGVLLFLLAVQLLSSDARFTVSGAFVFALCFVGAAVSAARLQRMLRDLKSVAAAAESLNQFLAIPVEEFDAENLKRIERVVAGIEMDHVTVHDSSNRKLLENVSLKLEPGKLIGVVATEPLQARALVELLMGFGRPVSGRLLFDGVPVTDLDPSSITKTTHWVPQSSELQAGSLQNNLAIGNQQDASAIVGASGLTETVQRLPDALQTLVSPRDDRLRGDDPFRIGIARALASDASVIVVDEPERTYDNDGERKTLEAIRNLVGSRVLSVVLPRRLLTLRECDTVVMVNEHTVVETGTHGELLQRNEYYRHLNYLRFNPFQAVR